MPADAELSRHDPDVPEWESLSPDARRLAARMMEVFAGFLSHTDHHIGRLLDYLERDRRARQHPGDARVRQRGQRRGRRHRHDQRAAVLQQRRPSRSRTSLAAIDELGGPTTFNHYPWGWTWAGNTPFRRWKRETYRGGTTRPVPACTGRPGSRPRRGPPASTRHIIDMVPTVLEVLGHRAAGHDPRRDAVAAPRRQLGLHLRRRRRARPGTAPSTSRCSGTAPSTTTAGAPSAPGPGPSFTEAGTSLRDADHRCRPQRPRRQPLGALPRSPRTPRRTTTWPGSTGTSSSS